MADLVQKLKDLGISDRSARYALQKTNNNLEAAAEYVFSGQADKDEVSNNQSNEEKSDENSLKHANDLILGALGRPLSRGPSRSSTPVPSGSGTATPTAHHKPTAGALAALGLRAASLGAPGISTNTPAPSVTTSAATPIDPPVEQPKSKSFLLPSKPVGGSSKREAERPSRSPSPFFRARKSREERRERERSPEIGALRKDSAATIDTSAAESDAESGPGSLRGRYRPRNSAYESPEESGNEADDNDDGKTDDEDEERDNLYELSEDDLGAFTDDDELWDPTMFFDEETEKNTEANAIYIDDACQNDDGSKREEFDVYGEEIEQDVLGEGPNVIIGPEPLFAQQSATKGNVRKSERTGLELATGRPTFARDRCTITIAQGDPDAALDKSGKRMRRYVVLSDLSEESRYAVEWAIGTVARDGDEIFMISVMEDESKVDPKSWGSRDQQLKLKVQKERQTTALLLVRQVTSLLERTHLNITITCQALHAKNARYMLLDLIDFLEPTLVIVGSRGLGQLKGILLGSTSHYLVQKSSVPVMVARRRLRRPLRRTNPEDLRRSPRVSLASANIEKTASSKQEDDIVDAADDDVEPEKDSGDKDEGK